MNPLQNCNHKNMKERETTDGVVSYCPECGLSSSTPVDEVHEVTQEVLDNIDTNKEIGDFGKDTAGRAPNGGIACGKQKV